MGLFVTDRGVNFDIHVFNAEGCLVNKSVVDDAFNSLALEGLSTGVLNVFFMSGAVVFEIGWTFGIEL